MVPPDTVSVADAATPESASVVEQLAAGTAPSAYVAPSLTPNTATRGAVLSIMIPPKVTAVEFPARSVQFPVTDWFAPSPATLTGAVLPATPEPLSLQLNVTTTVWLVQLPEL